MAKGLWASFSREKKERIHKRAMTKRNTRAFFLVILSLLIFSLFSIQERRLGGEAGVPLDDSWIHFQFARNVADGHGFSYNPGERTPGSTSPLWVYILAGTYKMTHDFILSSKILGLLFLLAGVWGVYKISLLIDPNRWLASFVALFTVMAGRLIWGALSGMEIGLFTSLTIMGIFFHMKYEVSSSKFFLSTLFLGLATLARPEGAALFLFALLDTAWRSFRKKGRDKDEVTATKKLVGLGLQLLIFGAIVFPQIRFCLLTTGRPLANTFYAKTQGIQLGATSVAYLIKVAYYLFGDHPLLFCTLPFGLWRIGRMALSEDSKGAILPLWFLGLPIFNAVINPVTWHHGRYFIFLIPISFLFSLHGLFCVSDSPRLRRLRLKEGFLILSLFLSIGLLFHWSKIYAQNVDNINQMDVRMGRWVEANLSQGVVLAVSDVGAIAFYSGRTIIDTDGLVTSEIIPFLRGMGREQGVFQYLFQRKPDFVIAFYNEFRFLTTRTEIFEPIYSLRVTENTILGGDRMVVYRAHWLSN